MAGYETLVKLDLLHTYYKKGRSKDMQYVPSLQTMQMMRNRRMLFREFDGGFGVLYENFGTGTPKITIDEDLNFVFGLRLANPALFLSVTNLDEGSPSTIKYLNGCRMYFYTEGAATQLKYKVLHGIYAPRFPFAITADSALTAIKITIKNEAGTAVVAQYDAVTGSPITGPYTLPVGTVAGQFNSFFDLSRQPEGYYTIEIRNAANNLLNTLQVFVHNELSKADIAGVLKITYPKPTPPLTAKSLTVNLERVLTKWKYYVVNKSSLDLDDIDIVLTDKGAAGAVYAVNTFTGNPVMGAQPAPNPADSVSGIETLVFESVQKIPFYEEPKTGLELKRINHDDEAEAAESILIYNLPNPGPLSRAGESSKVYIYV